MSDPATLASYIRYALSELSGRNGHFEFEELARHFARTRICANIVPATGPVAAGGDQGRDFETFRSYLTQALGEGGGFIGFTSAETLVFTCTLQVHDLASKIESDVDKACTQGTPIDAIYALCGAELPVAARHTLQEQVQREHHVRLEVIDRRALAEQLADADAFWIAERYLDLPAELQPPQPLSEPVAPAWYQESRDEWHIRLHEDLTYGDFVSIKDALRYSTFRIAARGDLPFWLALMEKLDSDDEPVSVRLQARYELAVASLRGMQDLRPVEERVKSFFADVAETDSISRLEDASVLLMYCTGARRLGQSSLSPDEILEWNSRLQAHVSRELERNPPPNRKAWLLFLRGHLRLQPDLTQIRNDLLAGPVRLPDYERFLDDISGFRPPADLSPDPLPMIDIEGGVNDWLTLSAQLSEATLFPVEPLANMLPLLAPLLVDQVGYRRLVDAVDARISAVSGASAAAGGCRDRALALLRADRVLSALAELHEAKVAWWSGDYLRGALLAMALIASCYRELGMTYAAKYYALALAEAAINATDESLLDLIPRGVLLAAQLDYEAGNWISATELNEVGIHVHAGLVERGLDPEAHPALEQTTFEQPLIACFAQASAIASGELDPGDEADGTHGTC